MPEAVGAQGILAQVNGSGIGIRAVAPESFWLWDAGSMRTRPDKPQIRQCEAGVTSTFVSVALGLAWAKAADWGEIYGQWS